MERCKLPISHTVVGLAASVAQADLAVPSDCIDQRADAAVVIGSAGRVLGDRVGDTRGCTGWNKVVDAEGGGHDREGREGEDSDRRHFD